MKRVLLACFIGIITTIALSSCSKDNEVIVPPYDGYSYIIKNVIPADWERNGREYTLIIEMPELDERYFQDGHVSVAISPDADPDYYYNIPSQIDDHFYAEGYAVGVVEITATHNQSGTSYAPEEMYVKIVLTHAEIGN